MGHAYRKTLFSDSAKAFQTAAGSRQAYARSDSEPVNSRDALGPRELAFIAARDSFYVASVSPEGWPYIQHRGGPPGFLKPMGENRIGFADYTGNKQYISRANLAHDHRVALFLMDYPNQVRLKMIGHARMIEAAEDPALISQLQPKDSAGRPERAVIIDVLGFDWNCPQHITQRFTAGDVQRAMAKVLAERDALRAEVLRLGGTLSSTSNEAAE